MTEGVCSRLLNLGLQKKVSQSIGIIVRCFVAGSSMTNPPKKKQQQKNNNKQPNPQGYCCVRQEDISVWLAKSCRKWSQTEVVHFHPEQECVTPALVSPSCLFQEHASPWLCLFLWSCGWVPCIQKVRSLLLRI